MLLGSQIGKGDNFIVVYLHGQYLYVKVPYRHESNIIIYLHRNFTQFIFHRYFLLDLHNIICALHSS